MSDNKDIMKNMIPVRFCPTWKIPLVKEKGMNWKGKHKRIPFSGMPWKVTREWMGI